MRWISFYTILFVTMSITDAFAQEEDTNSLNWGNRAVLIVLEKKGKQETEFIGNLKSLDVNAITVQLPFNRGEKTIPLKKVKRIDFMPAAVRTNMLEYLFNEYRKANKEFARLSKDERHKMAKEIKTKFIQSRNQKDFLKATMRIAMVMNSDRRKPFIFSRIFKAIIDSNKDRQKLQNLKKIRESLNKESIDACIWEILKRNQKQVLKSGN